MTSKQPETSEPLTHEEIRAVLEEIVSQTNINTLDMRELNKKIDRIMIEVIAYRLVFPILAICFLFWAIGRNS